MHKAPMIVLLFSGGVVFIALVLIGLGIADVTEIEIEEKAIFRGKSGIVQVESGATYTIFIDDHYRCSEATISISDQSWEYFIANCDSIYDETDWRMVGWMAPDVNADLDVEANAEMLIIDDIVYAEEGGYSTLAGGLVCCLGMLGLLVGVVMAFTMKEQNSQMLLISDPLQEQFLMQSPAFSQASAVVPSTHVMITEQPSPTIHENPPFSVDSTSTRPIMDSEIDEKMERYVQMLVNEGYPEDQAREHALNHIDKF